MSSATDLIRTFVIDFDGTIAPEDVSEALLDAFAPKPWWDIDMEFQRGEIGSRECLVRQGELFGLTVDRVDWLRRIRTLWRPDIPGSSRSIVKRSGFVRARLSIAC